MQYVDADSAALVGRHEKISLSVYLDGQRINAGVGACQMECACGSADAFSFGNACASKLEISLDAAMHNIVGKRIAVTWSIDGTEYNLFTGTVETGIVSAGETYVTAYDAMFYGGSDAFIPTDELDADISAAAAFSFVARSIGVEPDSNALRLLEGVYIPGGLSHLPDDTSKSAVAGYLAGLLGGNALIDRSGCLAIRLYQQVEFETEPYSGGARASGPVYSITGITLQRTSVEKVKNEDGALEETEVVSEFAAGDGTLMVSNPLADQLSADRVFNELNGLQIQPGEYSFPGGLLLEPGDLIAVHSMDGSYSVACISIVMAFDGGVKTTVICSGAAASGGAPGAINQALETLAADYAKLRALVADTATIITAKISNLTADDITAGKIHSTDFAVIGMDALYPSESIFPEATLYPNNGEQIIRGFEIDFSAGIIRGVFWSQAMSDLADRVSALEERLQQMQ